MSDSNSITAEQFKALGEAASRAGESLRGLGPSLNTCIVAFSAAAAQARKNQLQRLTRQ
ncbi:MAG TPA: hypothetical protein VLJ88_13880 [Propionibacteriaceae bacterium]|nr:hypothetical protein [Propionibacteriaceae bacterium]